MKKIDLKKHKKPFITFIIIILFIPLMILLNFAQIKYSSKLEKLGDNPDIGLQKSLIYYKEAEFLKPSQSLDLKIGKIYDEEGAFALSEKYFNKMKDHGPELTVHYLKQNKIDEAKESLNKINSPEEKDYYENLIVMIDNPKTTLKNLTAKKDDNSKEMKTFLETTLKNKNNIYVNNAIALFLYNKGYIKIAIDKLEKNKTQNKESLNLAGDMYFNQSEYGKAAVAYEKSIILDQYDIETYKKLLILYEKIGDSKKVEEIKDKIKNISVNIKVNK